MDFIALREPRVPIVANCDCNALTTSSEVREELVRGLSRCVQWKDSVRTMIDSGTSHFVEFGAGGVLSGLIKRIDRNVEVSAVADPESIRKLADELALLTSLNHPDISRGRVVWSSRSIPGG